MCGVWLPWAAGHVHCRAKRSTATGQPAARADWPRVAGPSHRHLAAAYGGSTAGPTESGHDALAMRKATQRSWRDEGQEGGRASVAGGRTGTAVRAHCGVEGGTVVGGGGQPSTRPFRSPHQARWTRQPARAAVERHSGFRPHGVSCLRPSRSLSPPQGECGRQTGRVSLGWGRQLQGRLRERRRVHWAERGEEADRRGGAGRPRRAPHSQPARATSSGRPSSPPATQPGYPLPAAGRLTWQCCCWRPRRVGRWPRDAVCSSGRCP